jgi:K+-sensing histidine kinase KdpD
MFAATTQNMLNISAYFSLIFEEQLKEFMTLQQVILLFIIGLVVVSTSKYACLHSVGEFA